MNHDHMMDLDPQMSADKLIRLSELIIEDFIVACHEEIPATCRLSRDALVDSLPLFLEALESGLVQGFTSEYGFTLAKLGREHGKVRAQQKYISAEDVVVEYTILSRVLMLRLRENAFLSLGAEAIVMDAIIRVSATAVTSFTEFRDFVRKNFMEESNDKLARALEKSQTELESFFMHSIEPMFMTVGKNHRFTLANEAFEKLVERPVLGESMEKIFSPEEATGLFYGLAEVFKTGSFYSNHSIKWKGHVYKLYLHPRWDAHGFVKGTMGIIHASHEVLTKPRKIFIEVRHHTPS